VKKALVGTGAADKAQVHAMVQRLLRARRSPGPMRRMRWRWRSLMRTTLPAPVCWGLRHDR
jgi:hypothetical protein